LNPEDCPCSWNKAANSNNPEYTEAHNNAIGIRAGWYVPGYREAVPSAMRNAHYRAANEDDDLLGVAVRQEIAKLEGVPVANTAVGTSLLRTIELLPRKTKRQRIMSLAADFPLYAIGADDDIPFESIPAELGRCIDPAVVAEAVRGKRNPILYVTVPKTNPGQQEIGRDVLDAALQALPKKPVIVPCYDRRSSFFGLILWGVPFNPASRSRRE